MTARQAVTATVVVPVDQKLTAVELPDRNQKMNLMHEDLARAQIAERLAHVERTRRASRIVAARRLARRAELVAQRARRARSLVALQ